MGRPFFDPLECCVMRDPVRVHRGLCLLLAVGIAASTAAAQPVIGPPVNQASFIPLGFP